MCRRLDVWILICSLLPLGCAAPPGPVPIALDEKPPVPRGSLPGLTFADDIYPIFRNRRCLDCHSGPMPYTAPGLEAYALSLDTPLLAWRELVPGGRGIRPGESLPDGRSAWPRSRPPEERWRVLPGHPERSSLVRKLAWDWEGAYPGMSWDEVAESEWGAPMPLQESVPIPEAERRRIREWVAGLVTIDRPGTRLEIQLLDPTGVPLPGFVTLYADWDGRLPGDVFGREELPTRPDGRLVVPIPEGAVVSRTFWLRCRPARPGAPVWLSAPIAPGRTTSVTAHFQRARPEG